MRLVVVTRHAESVLNTVRRVNGDPTIPVELTIGGEAQARALGLQLANLEIETCVHTRFRRTLWTAELALGGRPVPFVEEPLLDDVKVGELEGAPIERYREVKRSLGRTRPFPGGESLDDAARRFAQGYRRVLELGARRILVVGHEIALRYALNAAAGSDELDGPIHEIENATPYLFDEPALLRAIARLEELAGPPPGPAAPPAG
ncbi:MAG: histidine phosphatase family protein [Thermoleophilia bacterium]